MAKNRKQINIKGTMVTFFSEKDSDFICLTDMAKFKTYDSGVVISNWLTTKYTAQFMGAWEQLHNPDFNLMEYHKIKNEVGEIKVRSSREISGIMLMWRNWSVWQI